MSNDNFRPASYASGVARMVKGELADLGIKLTDADEQDMEQAIYRVLITARARNTNILKEGI